MSHAAGRKPLYSAGRRNIPLSVCRKSFLLIIYKYIMADFRTDIITKGNRTHNSDCVPYGHCPISMSSSPPHSQMLNQYLHYLKCTYRDVLGRTHCKTQQNIMKHCKQHNFTTVADKNCFTDNN